MNLMDTMSSVLAALARYTDADRLYSLDIPALPGGLVVERWQGREALSGGFEWWVDALSTDAHLPLHSLVGEPACLWTRAADGARIPRSGLVAQAQCVGADGGFARYRLQLVPWTWLLGRGRHSRVFQDRTVVQIAEAVFAGYAPLAAWQVGDEVGPFLADARPRSYCVQYRETDAAFLDRLFAEEGLGWRLEESEDAPAGHRLALFAASEHGPHDPTAAASGGIHLHRSDATEPMDTIQAWGTQRQLQAGAVAVLSHDYRTGAACSTRLPLDAENATPLELYDPAGAYAFASIAEADRYAALLAQAQEPSRRQCFGRGTVRSFRAGAWFTLTGAAVAGDAPEEALLVAVQHAGLNNLPDAVRDAIARQLGDAGGAPLDGACWPEVLEQAARTGYANAFAAVPRDLPWRPVLADGTGTRINPRPNAPGYQTAIVVGEAGASDLHSDPFGRVRVRFHFQEPACDGAARESCWLRVAQRYAGPGVGSQFLPRPGQEVLVGFLDGDIDRPIVVGALFNGQGAGGLAPTPGGAPAEARDADASAYARARDGRPTAQGSRVGGHAPPWHGQSPDAEGHRNAAALLGFQSREFAGDGHNRLVFDDSDGQLRLQLATTHAASQLTLGHLIHQADNYRGSFRGEGFELRSDRCGTLRAQAGLWLSAGVHEGSAPAGEHLAAIALLQQATQLGQGFSDVAGTHRTVRLAASDGVHQTGQSRLIHAQAPLQALLASARTTVDGRDHGAAQKEAPTHAANAGPDRVPHTGDALLGLSATAGIGLVAGTSLHWSVGETLTLAAGRSINAAVAGHLRLHTGQAIGWLAAAVGSVASPRTEGGEGGPSHALALVTGESDLTLQAQSGEAKLQSREQLRILSANAQVELAAGKTLHLATAGGASITVEGGNIAVACPGSIKVHAGRKSFIGPSRADYPLPEFPGSVCVECLLKAQAQGAALAAKNA